MIAPTRYEFRSAAQLSDFEGPLAADVTFPGLLVIHLVAPSPRPSEEEFYQAMLTLIGRYILHDWVLFGWNALDDEKKLQGFLRGIEGRVIDAP